MNSVSTDFENILALACIDINIHRDVQNISVLVYNYVSSTHTPITGGRGPHPTVACEK